MMDNLPELRDIHLPLEKISAFPPAYGWWLIVLVIAGLIALYYAAVVIRRTSAKIYARYLLKNLQNKNTLLTAVKISELLRRICIRKYPQAVGLSDKEWINFLNAKTKHPLQEKAAELLKNAPFMPQDSLLFEADDVKDLWNFCYHWIGENL